MALKTVQDSSLTAVANAIRVKAEIEGTLEFPTEFVSAIQNIPTGGGSVSVPPKEVNFYDYDGTVVNAYTASEFASLSAMPSNPKHTGLTAQGWNWSLADAKAYVAKYGRLNIGQMYVTTSGDTEIDIQLGIGRNKPYLGCCPNGTVEIDWGDGSAHDTLTGTSTSTLHSIQHVYPDTGEMFTIKLHMESGELGLNGDFSAHSTVLYNGNTSSADGRHSYQSAIKAIRFGDHMTAIGRYAFYDCSSLKSLAMSASVITLGQEAFEDCYSLKSITIPEGVTTIAQELFRMCYSLASIAIPKSATTANQSMFYFCYSLASVTLPEGISKIYDSSFGYCYSLASVTLPKSVTRIYSNSFSNCDSLASITIPNGVTTITGTPFSGCRSLAYLIFEPTTPPKASSSSAFNDLPSDLVVYIPAGTLSAYQSASNYSSIASKMVEMSA